MRHWCTRASTSYPHSWYHPMVVSHNNLLTLIGQESVSSNWGSTVRQVLSTFSRSLPVVVVSTLGVAAPNTLRHAFSAAKTHITLTTRRCIALSLRCGLPLAEWALTTFDGRFDSYTLQGFNSTEHVTSGSRCFKAWDWAWALAWAWAWSWSAVTLGRGTSIAISLAADALLRADTISGCSSMAELTTPWWAHIA